jgi:hypothetical protein
MTKGRLVASAITLLCVVSIACAESGLTRHEPPSPTPSPRPQQVYLNWASRACASIPGFETVANDWHVALDATPAPGFEELRDELLRLVSFDLSTTTSNTSQWLGLILPVAPPGAVEYHQTLFDLFLDFEPVLNYAEADIQQAQSLEDLKAIHASVTSAQERMMASVRQAGAGLSPEARVALQSVDECGYIRG